MTTTVILDELKKLGNEKTYAHNKKSGAHDKQFGVKLGDIRALAKKIRINHKLGLELWETGNIDAQLLSTLTVEPKALSQDELDKMVRSATFSGLADWLNAYVIKNHPDNEMLRQKWMMSKDPMALRAGWSLTAGRVTRDPDGLDIPALLNRIESEMPIADPAAQWTMNTTLAQIGINLPQFRERAIGIGERLGVYRDYPVSKGCTSPFAPIWINEMVRRQG